jgi:hypothetical protein
MGMRLKNQTPECLQLPRRPGAGRDLPAVVSKLVRVRLRRRGHQRLMAAARGHLAGSSAGIKASGATDIAIRINPVFQVAGKRRAWNHKFGSNSRKADQHYCSCCEFSARPSWPLLNLRNGKRS